MRVLRSLGLLGVGLIGGLAVAAVATKRVLPSRGDSESDEVGLVAIFDGVRLESRARAFRGGSVLAWCGGVNLDLCDAELAPGARLSVGALMGGVALEVPPEWCVKTDIRAVAGGVAVAEAEGDDPDAPVLTIDGTLVMGGVAVKRRPRGDEIAD